MSSTIDIFKEKLRDLLIQQNGDVKLLEHKDIIDAGKELGLTEKQINKLLIEVDSTINWELISRQKEDAIAREKKLKKDIEEQKKHEQNASETLNFIIEQCSKDKLFDSREIRIFFETSDELNQEERDSAYLLKNYLDSNNYIPLKTPRGASIKLSLQSTDWYKDKLPPPPTLPQGTAIPNNISINKKKIFSFIAVGTALFLLFYIFFKLGGDKNSEIHSNGISDSINSSNAKVKDSSQINNVTVNKPKQDINNNMSTTIKSTNEIHLKCRSLTELRKRLLLESTSKMINKDFTPQNVIFNPERFTFSCELVTQKSSFTKISLAYGPLNVGCESCVSIINKNPGSQILYETKDNSFVYKIIGIVE